VRPTRALELHALVERCVFGRYVPDSSAKRALTFFLLFVYHGAHALGRTFATALLAQESWVGLVVFTVADHAKFQLYKLARADFIYFMAGTGAPFSSLVRFGNKVLIDFVGFIHMRHPYDLGGACFLFEAITSQLYVVVATILYSQYYVHSTTARDVLRADLNADNSTSANATTLILLSSNDIRANHPNVSSSSANYTFGYSMGERLLVGKVDALTLLATVGTLIAVWTMAVVGLSLTIKREYLHTFWSTQTGYAYSQSTFLDHEGNDAIRINIVVINERHWRSIRERVRQWVLRMYATWEALKPPWFTDARKAAIPDDFMPAESLRSENARAPGGRRPSVAEMGVLRRASLAAGWSVLPNSGSIAASEIAVLSPPVPARLGGSATVVSNADSIA
jgi:hypothetical protein